MEELEQYIIENQEHFYRLAYSYVKDRDAALDVVQNAVLKALTHWKSLRNPAYLKTWFYRILINEGLNYIRKNRRIVPDTGLREQPAPEEDIPGKLDVYAAVERLSPKLRTIVVLRFFEDMSLQEIAEATELNLNTVKTRLYHALKILKKDMGQ